MPQDADRGPHFHVELTTSSRELLSEATSDKVLNRSELTTILEPLFGFEFTASVIGIFFASREELPAFIRYAIAPVQVGGVELEMSSGRYSVRGAPIRSVNWRATSDDPDRFVITLEAKDTRTFGPTYLEEIPDLLERAFAVFFRPEKKDG